MSSTKVKGKTSILLDTLTESLRMCTEEGNQISDKRVEDTCNESTSEEEQTASPVLSSSHIKIYSETQIVSTVVDHVWKIDQFLCVSMICDTLLSPSFSEKGQYPMKIRAVLHKTDQSLRSIRFYILTSKAFYSSCTTTIKYPFEKVLSTKSIWGRISNMTLLIELPKSEFNHKSINCKDALTVRCQFEIFQNVVSDTVHMKLLPLSTVFSKDVRYEDSTLDDIQSTVEESIKFIVGNQQYAISKKLLRATNSTYFKKCVANGSKVKDMTNILKPYEYQAFKKILFYIQTGSVELHDYVLLKQMLRIADTFDLLALKLTCEHHLLHHITINNAVELVQLAFSINAKFLKAHSAAFIKFHINEIADTKEFRDLPKKFKQNKIGIKSEEKLNA